MRRSRIYSSPNTSCIFCDIIKNKVRPTLAQSKNCAMFASSRPVAAKHFLVVPLKHVGNIKTLGAQHVGLLEEMQWLAEKTLREESHEFSAMKQARLVFHKPPFNSVEHLHLHCIVPPFANFWKDISFRPQLPWCTSLVDLIHKCKGD